MSDPVASIAPDPGGDGTPTVEELRRTLDDVGICIWSLDIPSGRISISPTCARLFGVPPERLTTFAATQALVHSDDRQARADAIQRALRAGEATRSTTGSCGQTVTSAGCARAGG